MAQSFLLSLPGSSRALRTSPAPAPPSLCCPESLTGARVPIPAVAVGKCQLTATSSPPLHPPRPSHALGPDPFVLCSLGPGRPWTLLVTTERLLSVGSGMFFDLWGNCNTPKSPRTQTCSPGREKGLA